MPTLERAFELVVKLYKIHFRFKLIGSQWQTNENESAVNNIQCDGGKRPGGLSSQTNVSNPAELSPGKK